MAICDSLGETGSGVCRADVTRLLLERTGTRQWAYEPHSSEVEFDDAKFLCHHAQEVGKELILIE